VGGRCATRRCEGQPVDHGAFFFHGNDPDFLAALESIPGATRLEGWPFRVSGGGKPCQPRALAPPERRLAYAEGMTAFPKHLAAGVDVRLHTQVERLEHDAGGFLAVTTEGTTFRAPIVVVALAVEQALALVTPLVARTPELATARAILEMMGTVSSLTVIAGYPREVRPPEWDVHLPESSSVVHVACHDSAKRESPKYHVIVYQCLPHWSRQNLETPSERWSGEVLADAARLYGPWAAHPAWSQAHRWRFARTDGASELSAPLLVGTSAGTRLGLAGEVFAPGGGIQGAWLSGRSLARRLVEKEPL
jgi:hypothetical protein